MSIIMENVSKKFGTYQALNQVSLTIPTGELVALLGPSGCGKTTLLRIIAGLEQADSGKILFHGEDTTALAPQEKKVGFVFQHYALFRHLSVFDNVAFGLEVLKGKAKPSKEVIKERVKELLNLVQMDWALDRCPHELSGGQRQRVALARALAVGPKVLLLDEPFSALDAKVRLELRRWLRKLHDELHITSVFVTHDQEEALELANQVVVMNQGNVEQVGTPDQVYEKPVNSFVYNFLGLVNVFHLRNQSGEKGYSRPHEMGISRLQPASGEWVEVSIQDIRIFGGRISLSLERTDGSGPLEAELSREEAKALDLKKGEVVFAHAREIRVFPETDYVI